MKHIYTLVFCVLSFTLLFIPAAVAQGVTNISLEVVPNAVAISWNAPQGASVSRYKIYYAHKSLLENNGRFDGSEGTIGNETNLALLDLANRGFRDNDTIFITVTTIDASGQEDNALVTEENIDVIVPGAPALHDAASDAGLENAIAENLTTVRLQFSDLVILSAGNPMEHFLIQEEITGRTIRVISVQMMGRDIFLITEPMTSRARYTIQVSDTVTAQDGSALNPDKRIALFIARGSEPVEQPSVGGPPAPAEIPGLQEPPPGLESMPIVEPEDITPPEDARNLILSRELQSNGLYAVKASWEESLNTEEDLAFYGLYESDDRGQSFVGPTALLATVTSTTIANIPPGTFTLKVTAMDETGNESGGIQKTIILPETGAAATLLLSLAGAAAISRRRNRR